MFHLLLRFAYTLDEPMVEYRAYPAMPWCGLLMVVGLRSLTDLRMSNLRWLMRPALGLLVVCYAMLSWSRSQVWQTEQAVVQDVLHRYPLNLRAMGIYFKDLMVRNQPEPVVMGQGMPDMVEAAILTYNEKGHRVYSERRLHLDYTSCQYFIVRALLLTGDHETALAKARSLLDAITTGKRFGSEESKASAYLSLMLCQEIAGDLDGLAETTRAAKEALRDAASLSEMLARELQLLGHDRANNWTVEAGEELKRDD